MGGKDDTRGETMSLPIVPGGGSPLDLEGEAESDKVEVELEVEGEDDD
jgi:hypothetical protein